MSDVSPATPTYLVDTTSDPVLIKVQGRATYLNCAPFGELLDELIAGPAPAIKIDFEFCTGLDSTVLGLIAGAAMRFQKRTPPGQIIARKLSPRNLEIIRNLGIERFLTIAEPTGQTAPPFLIKE
ncbi:MAG: STAS domain-containing protein, partial [Puniceicoccales bacterium]|nr:STAS domain-containing protein [Puniceicoccales bacterium]